MINYHILLFCESGLFGLLQQCPLEIVHFPLLIYSYRFTTVRLTAKAKAVNLGETQKAISNIPYKALQQIQDIRDVRMFAQNTSMM